MFNLLINPPPPPLPPSDIPHSHSLPLNLLIVFWTIFFPYAYVYTVFIQ